MSSIGQKNSIFIPTVGEWCCPGSCYSKGCSFPFTQNSISRLCNYQRPFPSKSKFGSGRVEVSCKVVPENDITDSILMSPVNSPVPADGALDQTGYVAYSIREKS